MGRDHACEGCGNGGFNNDNPCTCPSEILYPPCSKSYDFDFLCEVSGCSACELRPLLFLSINLETAAALTAVRHLGYESGFTNGRAIASICEDMGPIPVGEHPKDQRGGDPDGADGVLD